ncbi:MAG: UDP-forming cellulose synthase catalytic subunit [Oceanococcus sp.]
MAQSATVSITVQDNMNWLSKIFRLPAEQRRPWPFALDKRIVAWYSVYLEQRHIDAPQTFSQWFGLVFLRSEWETKHSSFYPLISALLHHLGMGVLKIQALWAQLMHFAAPQGLDALMPAWVQIPKWLIAVLMIVVCVFAAFVITTPMDWKTQFGFSGGMFAVALILRRYEGRMASLLLIFLSVIASFRYFWWRVNSTLDLDSFTELFFGLGLFAAEIYALLVLLLGYVQTAWPLRRPTAVLSNDRSMWPEVDIYIPTYNESLDVVKPTVFAAQNLDWPANKLKIHILDDGRRSEFRDFAQAAGVNYLTRPDGTHAKAGNLNHALTKTSGEFVAIFDCDHIPVSSFLTTTMGWFLVDAKCALVQTPHHFFSPDPLERNLGTFQRVPNEGRLFYGLIMDGNDLWNASYFCGSCAVLRRKPLEEVGGIAVETVTEDAHTALKMHRRGYNSVYINKIQAAGLATESLAGHIGQRIRWARGMAQIFTVDNPLLGKGLSLFQRLCYSNAMLHFFHGLPRIVFLTSPLAFLFFGMHIFNADAILVAAYVLPHLFHGTTANSQIQSKFRHAYWSEVYESLLAWYVAIPTTLALINPKFGTFNVTDKGGQVESSFFDWRISVPFLALIGLGFGGVVMGLVRLFLWDVDEPATVILNLTWATYNLLILGAAVGVAYESRQVRQSHRVDWKLPITLARKGQAINTGHSVDVSLGGMRAHLQASGLFSVGDVVVVGLPDEAKMADFEARVVASRENEVALQFLNMNMEQQRALIHCTFSRPDAWVEDDKPADKLSSVVSLVGIWRLGLQGYAAFFRRCRDGLASNLKTFVNRRLRVES